MGQVVGIEIDLLLSSHPVAFGLQTSSSPGITINAANDGTDQSLQYLTGIGTVDHATLDTEQLISCTRTALIDTIAFLQDSHGGVISHFRDA